MANGTTKLYPPTIGSSIPAFYKDSSGTALIAVPFSMSRGVGIDQIKGFNLKIKTAQTNTYLKTLTAVKPSNLLTNSVVYFSWNLDAEQSVKIGQYFKLQLAYIDKNDNVGYFSTVAIAKYTSRPEIYIATVNANNETNLYNQTYTGIYTPTEDKSERPYSYCFELYDRNFSSLIESSGWLLHNSSLNQTQAEETLTLESSIDSYTFKTTLGIEQTYQIFYKVRTINNLEICSPAYPCYVPAYTGSQLPYKIVPTNVFEEGYIDLSFDFNFVHGKNAQNPSQGFFFTEITEDTSPYWIGGQECQQLLLKYNRVQAGTYSGRTPPQVALFPYVVNNGNSREAELDPNTVWLEYTDLIAQFPITCEICRRRVDSNDSENDENEKWELITKVGFDDQSDFELFSWHFKDITVEQGVVYQYMFRQYNGDGETSEPQKSDYIRADFEDIFLCDKNHRQLKVRFNPKVSSFKITKLEAKMDTIGSKYPYIFRNDVVHYKEFPIGGLISYLVDNNEMFMSYEDDLGLIMSSEREGSPTEETHYEDVLRVSSLSYNIEAERKFKLELLEWLNDGEIKLFRSPTEGNYLVRLLNISLTPEDKLGRMLHNFQATAYEVEALTYDNLVRLGFIDQGNDLLIKRKVSETFVVSEENGFTKNGATIKVNTHSPVVYKITINIPTECFTNNNIDPPFSKFKIRLGADSAENIIEITTTERNFMSSYFILPDIYINPSDNANMFAAGDNGALLKTGITITYWYEDVVAASSTIHQTVTRMRNEMRTFYSGEHTFTSSSSVITDPETGERYTEAVSYAQFLQTIFERKSLRLLYQDSAVYHDCLLSNNPVVSKDSFDPYSIYAVFNNNNQNVDTGAQSGTLLNLWSYFDNDGWIDLLTVTIDGHAAISNDQQFRSQASYLGVVENAVKPELDNQFFVGDDLVLLEVAPPMTVGTCACSKMIISPFYYATSLYQVKTTRSILTE